MFLMVYNSENILFLYLHFTCLYGSWNHQRILKKHPFWKYDSCFSSEVSKLASVRNELIMSLIYWFIEAKNISFSERNKYYGAILVKINFCHAWKCMILGVFHQSGFWHLWRKPAIILSKWMLFQSSLVISWAI